MSNVLTWKNSGVGAKSGIDSAAFITDFATLFGTKSGDASFLWQVASSNPTTTPLHLVLKRKDGSPGRILIVIWTSAPAGNHVTLVDATPTVNCPFVSWFPNGNVDTPSNLAAASGTILGNDTGATKVAPLNTIAGSYGASYVPFYFESAESIFFGTQLQSATNSFMFAAGNIFVDALDNTYGGVYGCSNLSNNVFGTTGQVPFNATKPSAGTTATGMCMRTNYGSVDRVFYQAWVASGSWMGSSDYLTDAAAGKVSFVPVQLIGQLRDSKALDLKLRQVGYGPFSSMAFAIINSTGPVRVATQFCAATTGGGGYPWFTEFKI